MSGGLMTQPRTEEETAVTEAAAPGRRRARRRAGLPRAVFLGLVAIFMLTPLYVLVVNAFKPQEEILANPFGLPVGALTTRYLSHALHNPQFNIVRGYAVTVLFVVAVNVLSVVLAGPVAYVVARSPRRRYRLLLLTFLGKHVHPGPGAGHPGRVRAQDTGADGHDPRFRALRDRAHAALLGLPVRRPTSARSRRRWTRPRRSTAPGGSGPSGRSFFRSCGPWSPRWSSSTPSRCGTTS